MTENEAKGWLEYIGNMNLPYDRSPKSRKIACDTAIKALVEIQQYRAIGTIEELQKLKALFGNENVKVSELITKILKEYPEYLSIGTIEEFKDLKEKSVPKKPKFYAHNYYCTECGNLVGNNEFEWQRFLYCDKCGQKLDWQ